MAMSPLVPPSGWTSMIARDVVTGNPNSGPMSLGLLVGIAVAGAVIFAAGLGLSAMWLSRWRHRRRHRRRLSSVAQASDVEAPVPCSKEAEKVCTTTTASISPRKLQKRENVPAKPRRPASATSSPAPSSPVLTPSAGTAPVLRLPSFGTRFSRTLFRTSRTRPASSHGRKPPWIDEDALHGPKVTTQKGSKCKSLRHSWPLKNMVPTLPRLGGQSPRMQQQRREEAFLSGQQGPTHDSIHYISPQRLPQPPRPILAIRGRPLPRNAIGTITGANGIVDPQSVAAAVNLALSQQVVAARMSSTDSTLSEILRSTEKRLQDRTCGSVHRNRSATSLSPVRTKGTSSDPVTPTKVVMSGGLLSASMLADLSQPSTPTRVQEVPETKTNQCVSEKQPGTPAPEMTVTPTRKSQVRARSYSTSSSESSSLSTVYSIDETATQEGTTMISTLPNSSIPDLPKSQASGLSNDPFITLSPTKSAPQTPPRRLERARSVSPERRDSLLLKQLLGRASYEDPAIMAQQHSNCPPSCATHPAAAFSHGAGSNGEQQPVTRNGSQSSLSIRSEWLQNFDELADAVRESLDQRRFQTPQGPRPNPCLIITSPSDTSSIRTPASGMAYVTMMQRQTDVEASPTRVRTLPVPPVHSNTGRLYILNTQSADRGQIPAVPSVPDITGRKTWIEHGLPSPPPLNPPSRLSRRPRVCSISSSVYSQDTKDELGKLANELPNVDVPILAGMESPPPSMTSDPVKKPISKPAPQPAAVRLSLGNTISELRRMNSAVSSTSGVSSATGEEGSPTLPVLRGGGFSPTHKRGGSKNYLSLGTPPAAITLSDFCEAGSPTRRSGRGGRKRTIRQHDNSSPKQSPLRASSGNRADKRESVEPQKQVGFPNQSGTSLLLEQRRCQRTAEKRVSTESLGLYDPDGFLISSPIHDSPIKGTLEV